MVAIPGFHTAKHHSVFLGISLLVTSCLCSLGLNTVNAQNINDLLVLPPSRTNDSPSVIAFGTGHEYLDVPDSRPLIEAIVSTNHLARAAVFGDSTRLSSFAKGVFVPSAIPVPGQPFFGTGARANLQGSGSAIRLNAFTASTADIQIGAHADFVLDNAELSTTGSVDAVGFSVRRVVATVNGFTIGLSDSAFADPSAVPETIDLAGPNARITAFDAGIGKGQGRLSYDFFSQEDDGIKLVGSLEQAIAEVSYSATNESSFSYTPDFVIAPQYVAGDYSSGKFVEQWHLQLSTVFRSLAFETVSGSDESDFGWGTALSGAYRFSMNPALCTQDRIMFSVAYGEGISHYIADLNSAPDTGDAVVNATGAFQALPVLAWYCGFTHNWTDTLRSTITYSRTDLSSSAPRAPASSPYRTGDYLSVNLVHHIVVQNNSNSKAGPQNVFLGAEYLYGQKETLDGATGDAHRLMFVLAISK